MDAKEKVLATMKEAGQPLNAGKIAELSCLDRKEVDAAMKQLKAEGTIVFNVLLVLCPIDVSSDRDAFLLIVYAIAFCQMV